TRFENESCARQQEAPQPRHTTRAQTAVFPNRLIASVSCTICRGSIVVLGLVGGLGGRCPTLDLVEPEFHPHVLRDVGAAPWLGHERLLNAQADRLYLVPGKTQVLALG